MNSEKQWYSAKLSDLLQEDLRITTLNELKDNLKSLPNDEAAKIVTALELPIVFDCLNDSNTEQVDLACEVLSLCLNNLHLGESTTKYKRPMEMALVHPFPAVKLMALNEIKRSLTNEQILCGLCNENALILNILNCIGDSDIGVAKEALKISVILGVTVPGANKITSNEILVALQNIMSLNEVVRLRVYEMIVTICEESEYGFTKFKSIGLIDKIINEIKNNDVLLRLNIIEILSKLAQSNHGFVYLDETGVLQKILALINEDELTTQLCQPGILKFFGQIGHNRPRELLAKYPLLFEQIFTNIESSDLTVIGVTLDTIGYIGQTSEGKTALDSTGFKIEASIKTISRLLPSLPTEIRIRALNCIENLLKDTGNETMLITQKWFKLLGPDPMEIIVKYAKNPFSELRLAGLGILIAIADQIWGQEAIKNHAGLIEFLLDRSVETVKECKEAKYEILRLLNNSPVFNEDSIRERIEEYVRQGPFYVHAVTEVAVEMGD